jgi:hypothetical protein
MFVCCKKTETGCKGVPDCKCECSGCGDEWERYIQPSESDEAGPSPEECGDDEMLEEEA